MSLDIRILTIPHSQQRYPTVGDYWKDDDGRVEVRISELGDERHELAVAVHELAEYFLCRHRGIAEPVITEFDILYEASRPAGDLSEPGDSPLAPYRAEHKFATIIEMLLVHELGLVWSEYEATIEALCN